jgi:hypothetical protein
MKTAIYIEDGVVQLVLTPENSFEKGAIKPFKDECLSAQIFSGTFYDCRGGWIRQTALRTGIGYGSNKEDESIIIRIVEPPSNKITP